MSKTRLVSLFSIGLLIVNIALIWILFIRKPVPPMHRRPGNHDGPEQIVIDKLNLNGEQIKKYEEYISWHKQRISSSEHKLLTLKQQLYLRLSEDNAAISNDSLLNEIGKEQVQIELIHFQHFQDIKELCNDDQKPAFEEFSKNITELFSRKPPHGGGH